MSKTCGALGCTNPATKRVAISNGKVVVACDECFETGDTVATL